MTRRAERAAERAPAREDASAVRRRRRARATAGPVEPPPGLESLAARPREEEEARGPVAPPPGLGPPVEPEAPAAAAEEHAFDEHVESSEVIPRPEDSGGAGDAAACHVVIGGLPNSILAEPMMMAVLQQAGLEDEVLGFGAREGRPCGEARVAFASINAALRCVDHFEGCHWDASGAAVTARPEPAEPGPGGPGGPGAPAGQFWDALAMMELGAALAAPEAEEISALQPLLEAADAADAARRMRPEAPAFEPLAPPGAAEALEAPRPRGLSAAAPCFVPAEAPAAAEVPTTSPTRKAATMTTRTRAGAKVSMSDTSTEMGDSDGEDSLVPRSAT